MLVDRITFKYCVYLIYLSLGIISMLSFRILLTKLLICNDFFSKASPYKHHSWGLSFLLKNEGQRPSPVHVSIWLVLLRTRVSSLAFPAVGIESLLLLG